MREIRVFVSSTFKDFFEEREILSKNVFPELRKYCHSKQIEFVDIDLRWGITDEMVAEGKVLDVCFHEIKKSQPYFIGLLGERYGFVPEDIPSSLLNSYDWLQIHKNKSITELEILHGALLKPESAKYAFFYFRDPQYINNVKQEDRKIFFEPNQNRTRKLNQLKNAIRKSGLSLRENYPNPEVFGNLVLKDLKEAIDNEFSSVKKPNTIELEEISQDLFANKHISSYIKNQSWFDVIDQYVLNGGKPLIILGSCGIGKSALISNWIIHNNNKLGLPIIQHYMEASPKSAESHLIMLEIIFRLIQKCHLNIAVPVTRDPFKLKMEYYKTLNIVSDKGGAVLIFDGIDHMRSISNERDLSWLPTSLPKNIRIILTMTKGIFQNEFQRYNWQILDLKPLSNSHKDILTKKYFSRFSKHLAKDQQNSLLAGELTIIPRHLITILEELRIIGNYEQLGYYINKYSSINDALELHYCILERWENDYTINQRNLVPEFMSLLWASKNGLSETEIAQILGSRDKPYPMRYLSPILRASEYLLDYCSGTMQGSRAPLLRISDSNLHQAVKNKYLSNNKILIKTRLKLADFFSSQKLTFRGFQEILYQYIKSEEWKDLFTLLNQHSFLLRSWNFDSSEIKKAWIILESKSNYRAIKSYSDIISYPQNHDIEIVKLIAYLLIEIGSISQSIMLFKYIVVYFREKNDTRGLIEKLSNLGVALWRSGYYKDAIEIYKEQEELSREIGDKINLADCLGNLGNVLHAIGKLKDSLSCHLEEEKLCIELKDYNGLQACYGNQSIVYYDLGNTRDAFLCAQKQEQVGRTIYNDDAIAKGYGHQARILFESGDLDKAYELRKKEEEIYRKLGDKMNLSVSIGNQALIENSLGNKSKALKLHQEEEKLCRITQNNRGLQYSLGNQAIVHAQLGDFINAESLLEEQEVICNELGDPRGLIHCLFNRAMMLNQNIGKPKDALDLLERAYKLAITYDYNNLTPKILATIKYIRSNLI